MVQSNSDQKRPSASSVARQNGPDFEHEQLNLTVSADDAVATSSASNRTAPHCGPLRASLYRLFSKRQKRTSADPSRHVTDDVAAKNSLPAGWEVRICGKRCRKKPANQRDSWAHNGTGEVGWLDGVPWVLLFLWAD